MVSAARRPGVDHVGEPLDEPALRPRAARRRSRRPAPAPTWKTRSGTGAGSTTKTASRRVGAARASGAGEVLAHEHQRRLGQARSAAGTSCATSGVVPAAAARRSSSSSRDSSAVTNSGAVMRSRCRAQDARAASSTRSCGRGTRRPRLWTISGSRSDPDTYHGDMAGSRVRRSGAASHGRSAAFFDLDKTIIAKSSTLAFSKPFQAGGLITRGAMLRSAYAQFVYLVGGADHDQMEKIRAFMSQLVEGWDVETVQEIVAETLHHVVDPIVYDEAVSLIEEHHAAGRDVVIVSASGAEVVEPIGEMLGADDVIASRLRDRRRQVHRRDRLLRLRRGEGARDRGDGRRARLRPRAMLRLQRLDHRRPDARGGRSSPRGQPRQGAAASSPPPGAGRSCSSRARSPCAAASRSSRPWPPSPSAPPSRSAGRSGSTVGVGWARERRTVRSR